MLFYLGERHSLDACVIWECPVCGLRLFCMALTLSVVQSCGACFGGKRVRSDIVFKVEIGYWNSLGTKMRFNNFLLSKVSKIHYRAKHKYAEKLLQEVDGYETNGIGDHPKLLDKVSVLMHCNGFHDSIANKRAGKQSGPSFKAAIDDFDASLARRKYPSIILGSSPLVALYEENPVCSEMMSVLPASSLEDFPPTSMGAEWVHSNTIGEPWCSTDATAKSVTLEAEDKSNDPGLTVESPSKAVLISELDAESVVLSLDNSISCIPGLSKKYCRQLESCGFHTLRKLLHHFPRTYADLQNAQAEIDDGQYMICVGEVLSSRGIRAGYSFSFLEVVVACEIASNEAALEHAVDDTGRFGKKTIYVHLKKFFRGTRFASQPFLKCVQEKHKLGDLVCVSGKVRTMRTKDHYEMREYNIDALIEEKDSSLQLERRSYPIYPSKGGINPNFLRTIIARALESLPADVDPIPTEITQEFGLLSLHDAYFGIHQPKNKESADLARKRLIFDEFFYLQLGRLFQMLEGLGSQVEKDGLLNKYRKPELNATYVEEWSSLSKKFLRALPYSLTSSQLSAISEIIWDLKRPVPMNRLLQGDVGCGKTVVAFLACMEVIGSGYQAAFMVPTELLAVQHYEHMLSLLENMDDQTKPTIALLTGSTPSKQSRMIRQDLQSGDISLVIGTHSLIAEKVEFFALRIAVVDEQHRFGVIQRGRFNSKLYYSSISSRMAAANPDTSVKNDVYMAPHVLAMSATPIPRTLALALYGDMSLTQITDLPPGRVPVETYLIEGNDSGFENMYKMMLDELEDGGKVYLVYPVIEQSEQLPQLRAASADLEVISDIFEDYNCGLLHGKLKSDEKDEALRRFRSGETHILLSTQVIEIGVDVPDASMMVVMNAERFGIAQLHQLRGRVGRGVRKSKCILLASTASSLERLKVLKNSSDGFYLANMDLLLRGPGDLLGKKQSGHLPEFPIARLEIDGNILQEAHAAALKILGDSHDLKRYPALKAELSMRQPLSILGD
ncbi:ATP-dependent DNA helicase homolog RECG, chloroplastic isoform X2 [Tripterygium wilfordii]|uniref:ATP-dependent DNA helicase homolog RECG, chloroplastic isoform X2 n=1 Tax=Tripterygium wilfordii TaxID=458696 RepID=UPI0018F864E4|nr:ATP-dependent DNA helicase homolog RECG, chloroplastic isoform X2 [Tripterygium wilfordii]